MRPLIIRHGAWLRPAHHDEVTQRLRRDGVDVTAPDLAGRSLADSTRLVQDLIDRAAEAPVLPAHSFGGVRL
ncbi:hypothetical protein ACIBCD_43095 [Nocardia brasiliensis]|uniref:hypothetical protein n=1 Tax=Nocardia brasiliensis TaxID=37326 RepID=UPI002458FB16|nr:hypothetical protein [Nocardia brasiliensis]